MGYISLLFLFSKRKDTKNQYFCLIACFFVLLNKICNLFETYTCKIVSIFVASSYIRFLSYVIVLKSGMNVGKRSAPVNWLARKKERYL